VPDVPDEPSGATLALDRPGNAAPRARTTGIELAPGDIPAAAAAEVRVPSSARLPDGMFLVGAARASLAPAPDVFGGSDDRWETERCTSLDSGNIETDHVVPSLADARGWPAASPDCIYLGGFGIGPARPATHVGHGGVWVRALAVSNGERTFLYAIADTVGWFARYDSTICADCGIRDVRDRVAGDLGIDVGDVIVGSTHTHAGADTYGGWGGIPDWYRAQLRDAAVAALKQAVANLEQATIEVGETHLRDRNNERRDTYHSTADTGATWLRATAADASVIATWSTYAGHPTVVSEPILHADWPGAAARRFESAHGGVGLLFEGGLGNVSISEAPPGPDLPAGLSEDEGAAEATGIAYADAVIADVARGGATLTTNALAADVRDFDHPAMTNPGLTTLAGIGLFDREFTPLTPGAGVPGTYGWSKAGQWGTVVGSPPQPSPTSLRSCISSGPVITTTAGAHRIGAFAVAFGPGELFSTITEVVKEKADSSAVTMVLGQTNDALGYIIPSVEFDLQGNAATEYGTQTGEYEEVFSIDRCFGDHVLHEMLAATSALDT
jgi:hypothetical protein